MNRARNERALLSVSGLGAAVCVRVCAGQEPTPAPPPPPALDAPALPPLLLFPAALPNFPAPTPLGNRLFGNAALDVRTRTSTTGRHRSLWINEGELDLQRPFAVKGKTVGQFVFQLVGEDPADTAPNQSSARDVQVAEAYVIYKLPIQTDTDSVSYLKVGQFQVPFALLATYDPHLSLVQPLYAQALGERVDFGVALHGTLYGALDYDFSLTNGTGPDHLDVDPNRVVSFRLGRTFDTRNGVVNVGGSLLNGRLPVTDLDNLHPFATELPPSGRVRADRINIDGDRFAPKSRIAGDGTYSYGRIVARAEAMIGADKNNRIQGYYAEGNYVFGRRATATLARSVFVYPVGNSNTSHEFIGLTYRASENASVSGLYEYLRDVPRDSPGSVRHRFTVQVLLRF